MMSDWATTNRLTVRITLAEGMVIQGEVHLQPRVAWRDGPETPLEMLNREEEFFAVTLGEGDIVFVARRQVTALLYHCPPPEDEPARHSAARDLPLEIMMVGGAEYRGTVTSELPPTKGRPLDMLNLKERFFQLDTRDGPVCLNRGLVRAARPLG